MPEAIWKIPYNRPDSSALKQAGVSPLLAELLAARGVTEPAEAESLLKINRTSLLDPLKMRGMAAARDRVLQAVRDREKVAVFGDYDVDGITSTCLLTDWLRSCGLDCDWYIPDRDAEGYGLNIDALRKLREDGNSLVITVDCGITGLEEALFAREIGLDLVITDHHECRDGTLPEAVAVVDPKQPDETYPNPELAGVGVAFKLVCACSGDEEEMLRRYADLVAFGTVADVMPLTGENRYLVQCGLRKLQENPRPGFAAMMEEAGVAGKKPAASTIGYTLSPRLNAAGRLGQAGKAEELMLCTDPQEAAKLASALGELNRDRQKIETEIWQEARNILKDTVPDGPIVLASDRWHQGVIGIAASRLTEQFGVPTVMICLNGEKGKGSCRSCAGFNIYEALSACSGWLEGFGGHALAAGLTVRRDQIDGFREALRDYYERHRPEPQPDVSCDLLLCDGDLLSIENVRDLDLLEPYGNANPRPVFCICDVLLTSAYGVGAEKQHLKFSVDFNGRHFDGIFFSRTKEQLGVQSGVRVDLAFTPQINEYMGVVSVQLSARAMRRHRPQGLCERILALDSGVLWAAASFAPERGDFVRLWRRFGPGLRVADRLEEVLGLCPEEMEPERFCLCLAVFSQAGLLRSEGGGVYSGVVIHQEEKVDLEATEIMRILRGCEDLKNE